MSTCDDLDVHDPITIIFGRSVTEKVGNQTMLCFPTSSICASALPCEIRNPEDSALALCACNIIQMMHGCKWNIHICCPEVDMSSRGRSPSDDMSTEGQHI